MNSEDISNNEDKVSIKEINIIKENEENFNENLIPELIEKEETKKETEENNPREDSLKSSNNFQENLIEADLDNIKEINEIAVQVNVETNEQNYFNACYCKINIGIIIGYIYIIISLALGILVRTIMNKYSFKYNISLLLAEQFFCLIFFIICDKVSKTFKKLCGEISFKDFKILWWRYLLFSLVFMLTQLGALYGNLMVKNTAMYYTLRKLLLVMTYLYEIIIEKKKIPFINIISMILVCAGVVLVGLDDFSADYIGYAVVIAHSIVNVIYCKLGEFFRKKTGVHNLKLLVYHSFLMQPTLLIGVFIAGEYKGLYSYYTDSSKNIKFYIEISSLLGVICILVIFLNSSFITSTEKNSSFFTQLLGSFKDVIMAIAGYIILKDFDPTYYTISGIALQTIGAILIAFKSLKIGFKGIKKENKEKEENNNSENSDKNEDFKK